MTPAQAQKLGLRIGNLFKTATDEEVASTAISLEKFDYLIADQAISNHHEMEVFFNAAILLKDVRQRTDRTSGRELAAMREAAAKKEADAKRMEAEKQRQDVELHWQKIERIISAMSPADLEKHIAAAKARYPSIKWKTEKLSRAMMAQIMDEMVGTESVSQ